MNARLAVWIGSLVVLLGIGFSAGYAWRGGDVREARQERDEAIAELKDYRAEVKTAGAEQATQTAVQVIDQARISQEGSYAYSNHRESLEQRIAAGELGGSGCAVAGVRVVGREGSRDTRSSGVRPDAKPAAGSAASAAQSVPAGEAGSTAALPGRVEPSLPSAQLIEDAARDALQLAGLIDTACRLGLCAEPQQAER